MVSRRQAQGNLQIVGPRLLLVEGNDDRHFFQRLIERRQNTNVQIIAYEGKDRLGRFLANVLVLDPTFSQLVRVVGVVRDADASYQSAFQSVQNSLRAANLPPPPAPLAYGNGVFAGNAIKSVAYIIPDNNSPGDLETLLLDAVRNTPVMPCVDSFFECLQSIGHATTQERKARLRAFLAAHPDDPNLMPGQAISANVIPWDSPAFDRAHQLLDMLDAVN